MKERGNAGAWYRWEAWGGFLFLAVACLIVGLLKPRFLSPANLLTIAQQASPLLIAAVAQAFVVMAGEIDLSLGSAAAVISMVAVMSAKSLGTVPGILMGLLTGASLGFLNGIVVTRLRVPAFIATVGMLTYAQGIALYLGGGVPIEFPPPSFAWPGQGFLGPLPAVTVIAAMVLIFVHLVLTRTVFGRHLRATGGNRLVALLSGVHVQRVRLAAFVLSGTFTGLSAIVLASRVNSGQPYLYPSLPFEAIAALAVGGISLRGGEGTVRQILLGVLIFSAMSNALNFFAISSYVQQMITGAMTVLALLFSRWQGLPRAKEGG
ncbi:MAG: ABC transporter permease [Hydrogenibacillus sp.]|nr:ABC transporter permease [Hydrogenibacillus sp.]